MTALALDGGQTTGAAADRDKWTSPNNWGPNGVPAFDGTEDIVFASAFINGHTVTDMNGAKSILSLSITTATDFTITNKIAGALALFSGAITRTGSGTLTNTVPIVLGGGSSYSGLWSNANTSGQLVIRSSIAETGGSRSITLTGAGTTAFAAKRRNTKIKPRN